MMHHLIGHNLNVCIAKSKFYFFMLKKISTDDAPFVGAIPFLNATRKSFLTER